MCIACDEYKQGKIDGKAALKKVTDAIKVEMNPDQTGKLTKHLFEMSEMILAKEVPMPETDADADEAFWNATHRED